MLEVVNHTPFTVQLHPALDKDCHDYAVIVIKALCTIVDRQPLQLIPNKATIYPADKHFGNPKNTGVEYASDLVRTKFLTDVVVNGHAYAPRDNCAELDVGIQIDNLRIIRRVVGDRFWVRSLLDWEMTQPKTFDLMPLNYEHAFGGSYLDSQQQLLDCFAANPLGKGCVFTEEPNEGQPLPNLELPQQLIEQWTDLPLPAALGFLGNDWQPRMTYQGTYDESWRRSRAPLLPEDFDERFFNAAPNDLQIPHLRGGEQITLARLTPNGNLTFQIPKWKLKTCFVAKGKAVDIFPVLDTLVIEPDKMQAQLTWRTSVKCFNQFLYLDKVIVSAKDA
ncbi:MAG: DUF2169 domain-containing protein [Pseudomonadota bacterium]